jgi:hypothetical protein
MNYVRFMIRVMNPIIIQDAGQRFAEYWNNGK